MVLLHLTLDFWWNPIYYIITPTQIESCKSLQNNIFDRTSWFGVKETCQSSWNKRTLSYWSLWVRVVFSQNSVRLCKNKLNNTGTIHDLNGNHMMANDSQKLKRETPLFINEERANADPLWTVQEVSLYLRLKPETVRAMARRGQLPGMKIGRMWRFDRATIESLVQDVT